MRLPDTVLPDGLDPFEIQEAYRALKGHALRVEIYAEDGSPAAANPYTVTEQNFTIRCLQTMGANRHAVFFVHPRETLSFHYERSPRRSAGQPRDHAGDRRLRQRRSAASRSAIRAAPGIAPPEPALSAATQAMLAYDQAPAARPGDRAQLHQRHRRPGTWPDAYRAPLPSASDEAEITGVAPVGQGHRDHQPVQLRRAGRPIWQATVGPERTTSRTRRSPPPTSTAPASPAARRPGGSSPASGSCYRSDDLTALLPLGQLQPLALPGQSYQAALTPGLLSAIFGALVPAATLTEGGYVQLPGETGWWMPSGRVFYSPGDTDTPAQELANALASFFLPRRAVDPFGAITRVAYDGYALLPVTVTDPVGNVTAASNDYRVLQPATVTDPNGNRVSAAFDALGLVTATAVMGKTTETAGDLLTGFAADLDDATLLAQFADPLADPAAILGNATTRFLYDLGAYQRTSTQRSRCRPPSTPWRAKPMSPIWPPAPTRRPQATRYQYAFAYCDGFGREIQRKAQVAPGPVTDGGPAVSPRWVGSGWTIFDNKGRPVRKYEPFFSATSGFEFAAQTGVSTRPVLRPAGPRGRHAASRQHLGEDGLRRLAARRTGTATTPC